MNIEELLTLVNVPEDVIVKIQGDLDKLSESRRNHLISVANWMLEELKTFKYDVTPREAILSGLLHDITKELPTVLHYQILGNEISNLSKREFHGISGAKYCEKTYDIKDERILKAIEYHTTATKTPNDLDKLLYIADFIAMDRKFRGVEELREYYKTNSIDDMYYKCVICSIQMSIKKQDTFMMDCIEVYNHLTTERKNKEKK